MKNVFTKLKLYCDDCKNTSGFTLIKLMVVMSTVGLVISMSVSSPEMDMLR